MGAADQPLDELKRYGLTTLWNPNDPLMSLYTQIANTYKTNKTPPNFVSFATACMIARMVLYDKGTPGDCGTQTHVSTGNVGSDIQKLSGPILATAAALAGTGVGILAAIPLSIVGAITASHAKAVATEQTDLCGITTQVNAIWQNIDAAVANGSMSATQAIAYFTQLQAAIKQTLSGITQDCNAACVIIRAISCVCDLRTNLYKSAQQGTGGIASVQALAASLSSSNTLVYAAVAATAAHFAGVF